MDLFAVVALILIVLVIALVLIVVLILIVILVLVIVLILILVLIVVLHREIPFDSVLGFVILDYTHSMSDFEICIQIKGKFR